MNGQQDIKLSSCYYVSASVHTRKSLTLETMTIDRATLPVGHLQEAALASRREIIRCSNYSHVAAELRTSH